MERYLEAFGFLSSLILLRDLLACRQIGCRCANVFFLLIKSAQLRNQPRYCGLYRRSIWQCCFRQHNRKTILLQKRHIRPVQLQTGKLLLRQVQLQVGKLHLHAMERAHLLGVAPPYLPTGTILPGRLVLLLISIHLHEHLERRSQEASKTALQRSASKCRLSRRHAA